ncbi:MAG: ParA family protein [Oscillospiraceae bacterium]|nr:ParA family protein [Oscillospiraceae bacterium]
MSRLKPLRREGIFSRDSVPGSGGLLAVWGSPGSGKTAAAVKIAVCLAKRDRQVILLLCGSAAPELPCLCPAPEEPRSLGSILAAAHVTRNLLRNHLVSSPLETLRLLGMRRGENARSYPPGGAAQAGELLDCLRAEADCVVCDCAASLAEDALSLRALLEADRVLRLSPGGAKAASFFASQLPLLREEGRQHGRHWLVSVGPGSRGKGDFSLAFPPELEGQRASGSLLSPLTARSSRAFLRTVEAICREVFP